MLVEENIDTQIKLTYRLLDPENTGKIKAEFVKEVLKSAVSLCDSIKIPDEVIAKVVENSFVEFTK